MPLSGPFNPSASGNVRRVPSPSVLRVSRTTAAPAGKYAGSLADTVPVPVSTANTPARASTVITVSLPSTIGRRIGGSSVTSTRTAAWTGTAAEQHLCLSGSAQPAVAPHQAATSTHTAAVVPERLSIAGPRSAKALVYPL